MTLCELIFSRIYCLHPTVALIGTAIVGGLGLVAFGLIVWVAFRLKRK